MNKNWTVKEYIEYLVSEHDYTYEMAEFSAAHFFDEGALYDYLYEEENEYETA